MHIRLPICRSLPTLRPEVHVYYIDGPEGLDHNSSPTSRKLGKPAFAYNMPMSLLQAITQV